MIAVLADDISGAAELAALARQCGLQAAIHLASAQLTPLQPIPTPGDSSRMFAIDTQSRSLTPAQAPERIASITRSVLQSKPSFLYKKIDSVLRGHVLAEIRSMMEVGGLDRALLIPANPTRNRVIRQGHYFVDGKPLHQTAFAQDPDFPARTSDVQYLLGSADGLPIHTPATRGPLPQRGITMPDVESPDDLAWWSSQHDDRTLAVGGGEFFAALLKAKHLAPNPDTGFTTPPPQPGPVLFVCGSLHAWESARRIQCETLRIPVAAMPDHGWHDPTHQTVVQTWTASIIDALARAPHHCAMAAIGLPATGPSGANPVPSHLLVNLLAKALEPVLRERPPARILIEGGATAQAVLHRMQWNRLTVGQSLAPGFAPMLPQGMLAPQIWIKPGSYPWPESLLGS